MKLITIALVVIVSFMLCSCSTPNQLNSQWKSSIAQLQITPIMPLRERIEIGESFRYLKKPTSFKSDGQLEPGVGIQFNIKPNLVKKDQKRKWPIFNYDANTSVNIGASLNSIATFSGIFGKNENISLKVDNSYSEGIEIADLLDEISEKIGDEYYIKKEYEDKVCILINYYWKSWSKDFPWYKRLFKRKVIFLRIPTEVYYVQTVQITLRGDSNNRTSIKPKDELNKLLGPDSNFEVTYSENNSISLNETLHPPMAIGYRGIILQVGNKDIKGYKIYEYPEDANLEFWSDL